MRDDGGAGRRGPARLGLMETGGEEQVVFLTVLAAKRREILARRDVVALLLECWERADEWVVGRWVVMPDHLHLFCAPAHAESLGLRRWVGYWKSLAGRRWPRREEHPVWHLDCWDRQIRNGESYSAKWEYVRANPVRHGLVENAEDWEFQGEMEEFRWG